MKKIPQLLAAIAFLLMAAVPVADNGYQIGDVVEDFRLKNVDGNYISLANYPDAKGFIVIFTCNTCPVARGYEDRIIALDKKYRPEGYPVIAINPNDAGVAPDESYEKMQQRAKEKGFTFPYLLDPDQVITKRFAATHTPHTYVLRKSPEGNILEYFGAIDNDSNGNPNVNFVENVIAALQSGNSPEPRITKAVGCTIKWKKSS